MTLDKPKQSPSSSVIESITTPSAVTDNEENKLPGKSTSLKYTYKDGNRRYD